MAEEKTRMFGLDVVRAGAVLLVVFHHSFVYVDLPGWLRFFGPLGSLGAESLLVLSGYLIGQGLLKKLDRGSFSQFHHLREFYFRRWLRTLPPYYVFLFVMAALFPPFWGVVASHLSYFLFLQNLAWDHPLFYSQSWTLAILEFFYLLFPLTLLLCSRIVRHRVLRVAIPIALFLLVPLALRSLHLLTTPSLSFDQTYRKWVIFRLDSPIVGVIMAVIQSWYPALWAGLIRQAWLGLLAIGACAAYYLTGCPGLETPSWWQVFFFSWVSICVALLFPLLTVWKLRPGFVHSTVQKIADTSYSLYVSHYVGFTIGLVLLVMLGIPRDQWIITSLVLASIIAFVVYLSYQLIEAPCIRLRESKTPPQSFIPGLAQRLRAFRGFLLSRGEAKTSSI